VLAWQIVAQVLDDKNVRRRFRASNYQSMTRVKPFICTMPMRLDDGWNQIQFNLSDFTRRAYVDAAHYPCPRRRRPFISPISLSLRYGRIARSLRPFTSPLRHGHIALCSVVSAVTSPIAVTLAKATSPLALFSAMVTSPCAVLGHV
jgi:hypothetical protein